MTSRVIIGPDGKYVPQPELTPGVYSPCICHTLESMSGGVIYEPPAKKQTVISGRVAAVFLLLASMAAFVIGVLVGRAT